MTSIVSTVAHALSPVTHVFASITHVLSPVTYVFASITHVFTLVATNVLPEAFALSFELGDHGRIATRLLEMADATGERLHAFAFAVVVSLIAHILALVAGVFASVANVLFAIAPIAQVFPPVFPRLHATLRYGEGILRFASERRRPERESS